MEGINCPVCGNLCSPLAAKCPSCAHPLKESAVQVIGSGSITLLNTLSKIGVVVGGIAAFLLVLGWFNRATGGYPGESTAFLFKQGLILIPLSVIGVGSFIFLVFYASRK